MNIFVAKLSSNTTSDQLQDLFETYGEVASAKVIIDRETGNSKGFGFVEMPSDQEGNEAINELNEKEFNGSTIVVKVARPREENGGGGFRRNNGGGFNRGGNGGGFNRDRGGNGGGFNRGGNRY